MTPEDFKRGDNIGGGGSYTIPGSNRFYNYYQHGFSIHANLDAFDRFVVDSRARRRRRLRRFLRDLLTGRRGRS